MSRVRTASLINPGPVDDICQDNAHRVGAPNHHHNSGSGENPMVGTRNPQGHVPEPGTARGTERGVV
jgi:hypothetical protein